MRVTKQANASEQKILDSLPQALLALKNPPKQLFYKGQALHLLEDSAPCEKSLKYSSQAPIANTPATPESAPNISPQATPDTTPKIAPKITPKAAPKVAIVGSRKPNPYTKSFVATLAGKIASLGGVVVSGGALGVDIIAHTHAFPRTIMFSPSSLEILYPRANAPMIAKMMDKAIVISEYERDYMPHRFSFLERNRLVIALSDVVIIPQADLHSGSMASARIALELQKPLFVLPHRLGESNGTNALLQKGAAQGIYDIEAFLQALFGSKASAQDDEILFFCRDNPSFESAFARFGEKLFEYELEGKIARESGSIRVLV